MSKERKLRIFGVSNQDTAVYWFRVVQPLRWIAKQQLATVHHLPLFGQHMNHLTSPEFTEYFAKEGKWADVLVSTLATNREYLALLLAMKERYKLKLVIDVDDDVLATYTEPNNPAYRAYLMPGARFAEYAQACMREADLLVVSTEYLARKYASLNENIVVINNAMDMEFFMKPTSPAPESSAPLTIGYMGSASHQKDWEMVEPILAKMQDEYGVNIKVIGPMQVKIPADQTNWVPFMRYPEAVASMQMDIGIAPLKDSLMNRAKSNLRWLEYSSQAVPTIASDVVPFRGVDSIVLVKDRDEWEAALRDLITDNEKRTALGQSAYNEVRSNYTPDDWSRKLFERIRELV